MRQLDLREGHGAVVFAEDGHDALLGEEAFHRRGALLWPP